MRYIGTSATGFVVAGSTATQKTGILNEYPWLWLGMTYGEILTFIGLIVGIVVGILGIVKYFRELGWL